MTNRILIAGAILAAIPLSTSAAHADDNDFSDRELTKVDAEPGHAVVPAMKPAWCDLTDKFKGRTHMTGYIDRSMNSARRGFYEKYVTSIAEALCAHPDKPTWHKQTANFVQLYVNITGLDTKGAIASIRARLGKKAWESAKAKTCDALAVSDEASPAEKRLNDAKRTIYGCRYDAFWRSPQNLLGEKIEWDFDKTAEFSSELLKAYYVLGCFNRSEKAQASDKHSIAPYAVCGIDGRSLDPKRLENELTGAGHNAYSRTIARETFASAVAAARRMKTQVDKAIKQDQTLAQIFYTVPETTWKKWLATYAAHKPMFDAARSFEHKLYGPSKAALSGCLPPLRKQLGDYLASKKPKNLAAVEAVLNDHVGATLLAALMPCAATGENKWEAKTYRKLYDKTPRVRGPRYAVHYAVANEAERIKRDRARFPLAAKDFGWKKLDDPYAKYSWLIGSAGISKEGFGVVRKVKKVAKGVLLTFKTVRWQEDIWDCRSTGEIWRIDETGVKYHETCVSKGKKWESRTEKSVIFPTDAAAGIGKGSFVEFYADYPSNDPKQVRLGFPWRAYKTKNKKKLVHAYGDKL